MIDLILYVLMVAPSPTDDHVMNYAVPLGIYSSALECAEAASWIDEHGMTLPRHLFCMPMQITPEGEPL